MVLPRGARLHPQGYRIGRNTGVRQTGLAEERMRSASLSGARRDSIFSRQRFRATGPSHRAAVIGGRFSGRALDRWSAVGMTTTALGVRRSAAAVAATAAAGRLRDESEAVGFDAAIGAAADKMRNPGHWRQQGHQPRQAAHDPFAWNAHNASARCELILTTLAPISLFRCRAILAFAERRGGALR